MKVHRNAEGNLYVMISDIPRSDREPFRQWLDDQSIPRPDVPSQKQEDVAYWEDYQQWLQSKKPTLG